MKKQISTFACVLFFALSFGQNPIDIFIEKGIEYHEAGQYDKAIELYKEALKIDPHSTLAHYEIAMTYFYSGNNKKAIEHADFVIKQDKDYLLGAYIVKGSSLDNLGKVKESIKLFEKGIKKFGNHYLLNFNLGVNYAKIEDSKKAGDAFIKAINNNSLHSSSHRGLAFSMFNQENRIQGLLSSYYFLLLEPASPRSPEIYKILMSQLSGNVKRDSDNPNTINININMGSKKADSDFSSAEMMLALLEAAQMGKESESESKTDEELFIEKTTLMFKFLGEMKESKENRNDFWWNFYVTFFYKLALSEHIDTFCYLISSSSNYKAKEWIEENQEKMNAFQQWLGQDLKE